MEDKLDLLVFLVIFLIFTILSIIGMVGVLFEGQVHYAIIAMFCVLYYGTKTIEILKKLIRLNKKENK